MIQYEYVQPQTCSKNKTWPYLIIVRREMAGKSEIGIAKHRQKLCTDKCSIIQLQLLYFHTSCMHACRVCAFGCGPAGPRYIQVWSGYMRCDHRLRQNFREK